MKINFHKSLIILIVIYCLNATKTYPQNSSSINLFVSPSVNYVRDDILNTTPQIYYLTAANFGIYAEKKITKYLSLNAGLDVQSNGVRIYKYYKFRNQSIAIPVNLKLDIPFSPNLSFYTYTGITNGYSIKQDRSKLWFLYLVNRNNNDSFPATAIFFNKYYFGYNFGYGITYRKKNLITSIGPVFSYQINSAGNDWPAYGHLVSYELRLSAGYLFKPHLKNFEKIEFNMDSSFSHSKNAFYIEIGGNSVLYSINYERVLYQHGYQRYLFRIGYEHIPTHASFYPISIYVIHGYNKHFLEGGISVLPGYFYSTYIGPFHEYKAAYFKLIMNSSLITGYRYQPKPKGFIFRATLTPFVYREKLTYTRTPFKILPLGGISFGWAF